MKKNTGCGCNDHNHCPPAPASDTVKSDSFGCEVEGFSPIDNVEETIVLQDVLIQTLVEADIKLPSYASDIKHIKKNVYLTQCKAIPVVGNEFFVKLFVEGYVHKNIQYSEDGNGCIKDYSVNIPFKCYHQVELASPVVFPFGTEFSVKQNVLERRELAKDGMGADRCNFGSFTFEINNEPIKCKLLASAVNQWDMTHNFDNWGRFNKITEKMEVLLALKLTQLQQTEFEPPTVPPTGPAVTGLTQNIYSTFRRITGN